MSSLTASYSYVGLSEDAWQSNGTTVTGSVLAPDGSRLSVLTARPWVQLGMCPLERCGVGNPQDDLRRATVDLIAALLQDNPSSQVLGRRGVGNWR